MKTDSKNLGNVKEMGKFLDTHDLPKLNQETPKNLNRICDERQDGSCHGLSIKRPGLCQNLPGPQGREISSEVGSQWCFHLYLLVG